MNDRGSASVVAVGVIALVVVLAAGLGVAAQLLAVWSHAATAADAAALAAAPVTFTGGSPRAEAARYAAANGARLLSCVCRVDPTFNVRTVEVVVATDTVVPLFGRLAVPARSRAEFDPMGVASD